MGQEKIQKILYLRSDNSKTANGLAESTVLTSSFTLNKKMELIRKKRKFMT